MFTDYPDLLSVSEVGKILYINYYIPIMLATYYGLTRSEVLGLRWKSIDFEKSILRVEHKVVPETIDGKLVIMASDKLKTDARRRTLPLIEVVANELKAEQEKQRLNKKMLKKAYNTKDQEYVCVDATGKLLMPNTLSKHFNLVLTKNGLRTIRFHDLRHTCASLLVANGVSMKQIQIWLGHSNYSTTADVYSHLESTAQLESANCIERVLSKTGVHDF
ncbi:MAG TPA: hypothetical protein DEB31_02450 [Clostridiales bacterium]|nr:hypothetical protein [Clostridiales bacterium]